MVLRRVVVFVGVDGWCYWLLLLSTEDCKGNCALHGEYGVMRFVSFVLYVQVLGGKALQEVAQKLVDHHAKMTNIFKEMYGDVRSVPHPSHPSCCFLRTSPHDSV